MHGWFNAVELLVMSKNGRECMRVWNFRSNDTANDDDVHDV